jgi:hypothetical protein
MLGISLGKLCIHHIHVPYAPDVLYKTTAIIPKMQYVAIQ